jgi:hypothetical protein
MALARIISRSHQCSRELALDLLARGYAVEIVSPDAIPDNLADLELRVEADVANQLTASVAAHGGTHAASLDFVHHLKAPMGDFVRRPPLASPTISFPTQPISFNAEPGVAEDVALPSGNWHAPEAARPKLGILPDPEESARLITPPEQLPAPPKEPAQHVRRGLTFRIHRSKPKQLLAPAKELAKRVRHLLTLRLHRSDLEQLLAPAKELARGGAERMAKQFDVAFQLAKHVRRGLILRIHRSEPKQTIARSPAWFWRAGIAFAAVVVLALVLGRGLRWGDAASADPASQIVPGQTAVPSEAILPTNGEPKHVAAPKVVPSPAGKSEAKSAQTSHTPAPRVHAKSRKSRDVRSRSREQDLVARDTVIYFDKSARVSPVKDSRRRASSQKQNGGHAPASTVTDLR